MEVKRIYRTSVYRAGAHGEGWKTPIPSPRSWHLYTVITAIIVTCVGILYPVIHKIPRPKPKWPDSAWLDDTPVTAQSYDSVVYLPGPGPGHESTVYLKASTGSTLCYTTAGSTPGSNTCNQ